MKRWCSGVVDWWGCKVRCERCSRAPSSALPLPRLTGPCRPAQVRALSMVARFHTEDHSPCGRHFPPPSLHARPPCSPQAPVPHVPLRRFSYTHAYYRPPAYSPHPCRPRLIAVLLTTLPTSAHATGAFQPALRRPRSSAPLPPFYSPQSSVPGAPLRRLPREHLHRPPAPAVDLEVHHVLQPLVVGGVQEDLRGEANEGEANKDVSCVTTYMNLYGTQLP